MTYPRISRDRAAAATRIQPPGGTGTARLTGPAQLVHKLPVATGDSEQLVVLALCPDGVLYGGRISWHETVDLRPTQGAGRVGAGDFIIWKGDTCVLVDCC